MSTERPDIPLISYSVMIDRLFNYIPLIKSIIKVIRSGNVRVIAWLIVSLLHDWRTSQGNKPAVESLRRRSPTRMCFTSGYIFWGEKKKQVFQSNLVVAFIDEVFSDPSMETAAFRFISWLFVPSDQRCCHEVLNRRRQFIHTTLGKCFPASWHHKGHWHLVRFVKPRPNSGFPIWKCLGAALRLSQLASLMSWRVKLYCSQKSRFDNRSKTEIAWRLHFTPFTSMSLWQISSWLSWPPL